MLVYPFLHVQNMEFISDVLCEYMTPRQCRSLFFANKTVHNTVFTNYEYVCRKTFEASMGFLCVSLQDKDMWNQFIDVLGIDKDEKKLHSQLVSKLIDNENWTKKTLQFLVKNLSFNNYNDFASTYHSLAKGRSANFVVAMLKAHMEYMYTPEFKKTPYKNQCTTLIRYMHLLGAFIDECLLNKDPYGCCRIWRNNAFLRVMLEKCMVWKHDIQYLEGYDYECKYLDAFHSKTLEWKRFVDDSYYNGERIHKGPRGGRYIIVENTKRYISRRR